MIRNTKIEDINEIIELMKSVYFNAPYDCYLDYNYWLEFIKNNHSFVYVIDNKIVGHSALEIKDNFGILSKSFVDEKYRNQGIYKKLIDHRLELAKSLNLDFLETYVTTHNIIPQKIYLEEYDFNSFGLKLLDTSDLFNSGQRTSLVILRKKLNNNYEFKTESLNFSKIKLHPIVVKQLNLDKYCL